MRKIITLIIFCILVSIFSSLVHAQSTRVIIVDVNADWPGDGTPLKPFRFIREGVNRANSDGGGILSVRRGIYFEHIKIEKPLTIRVDGPGTVTIGSPTVLLNDDSREIWTFRMTTVVVEDPEDNGGDEPYFLLFGIRSRVGSPGSTTVHWRGELSRVALDLTCCRPATIPPQMGSFSWSNVNSLDDLSSGDGPDVLGVVLAAIDNDACPWGIVRGLANDVREFLRVEIENLIAKKIIDDIILLNPIRINPDFEQDLADTQRRFLNRGSDFRKLFVFTSCLGDLDDVIEFKMLFFMPTFFDFPDSREELRFKLRRNRPHIQILLTFIGNAAKWRVAASIDLTGSDAN